jgi:hypothetical protein
MHFTETERKIKNAMNRKTFLVLIAAPLLLFACSGNEQQNTANTPVIEITEYRTHNAKGNTCSYCGEIINNNRLGGLIETAEGNHYFGSLECVAGFALENNSDASTIWVADYHAGERIVKAHDARFMRTDLLRTPNKLGLMAYTGKPQLDDNFKVAFGGDHVTWEEVLEFVSNAWNLSQK